MTQQQLDKLIKKFKSSLSIYRTSDDLYNDLMGHTPNTRLRINSSRLRRLQHYAKEHQLDSCSPSKTTPTHAHSYKNFIVDDQWSFDTYILAFQEQLVDKDYLQIHIPVVTYVMPTIAREIFELLKNSGKDFRLTFAHDLSPYNICLWVLPETLDATIDELQRMQIKTTYIPTLFPKYRGFAISRRHESIYVHTVAATMFTYLKSHADVSFAGYFEFIKELIKSPETLKKYGLHNSFDATVLERSLQLVLENRCPITDPEISLISIPE